MMITNPIKPLNEFFFRTLVIQKSAQSINDSWLDNVHMSIANHMFTDPFNVDIQDNDKQIEHFNKIFKTNYREKIIWSKKISSEGQLVINKGNKERISKEFLSTIYCQLSVPIFEDLCSFLKTLLPPKNFRKNSVVIDQFDDHFREQLTEIDKQKIIKTPTTWILHNLRLFRNCITHGEGEILDLENEFIKFNNQTNGDKKNEKIIFYGSLKKEAFHYIIDQNSKFIQLNNASFIKLIDLYSQLAYIAYLCYCNKHKIQDCYR